MAFTVKTQKSPEELFKKSKRVGATSIEQGILLVKEALVLAQKQSKHELEFDLLLCLAKYCRFKGKGFESLAYSHKANRVLNKWLPYDKIKRSYLYRELGTLYSIFFKDHATSLEYTLKSLSMNNPEIFGMLNSNIGTVYIYTGQFDKALPYLNKAKKIFIEDNNQVSLSYVHASFGEYYQLQNKTSKAITAYQNGITAAERAYKNASKVHNVAFIHCFNSLGLAELYLIKGNYTSLTKLIEKNYLIANKFTLHGVHSNTMVLEGKMYLALEEETYFKKLFHRAVSFCEQKGMLDPLDFWYKQMIELCEQKHAYKEALQYSKALNKNKEAKELKTEKKTFVDTLKNKEVEIMELEKRNNEIQTQRDQLQKIAYVVAHDLKTPTQNISHFISLFLRKYKNKLKLEEKFYLDFAIDNSKTLHSMLDELLIYFSIDKIKLPQPTCDLKGLFPKILEEHKALINKKKAIISSKNLSPVNMQEKHLTFILSRMIKNSLKFSRKDTPLKINIELIELPNDHRIVISDNGIGVDAKYKHQIFDLFKQLDKNNYRGVGMSLAICKKIIGLYGGTVQVRSNPDQGATFQFNIPKKTHTEVA